LDSLWTFEMMIPCLSHIKNEKCGFKKCHSNIKTIHFMVVYKKIHHHKMNNLIVRCIKKISIFFFHIKKFNSLFSSFFTIEIPFHIEIFNFFSKFLDQSHV
jgi:hypothetical protein